MFVQLSRYSTTRESTLGTLYINGSFETYTLEDTKRAVKVAKETRIHDGLYDLGLRVGSPMEKRYRAKYAWHLYGMIWIQDVPEFEYVYIHPGNTKENTEGCILTGDQPNNNTLRNGYIASSVLAYKRLYKKVVPAIALQKGNPTTFPEVRIRISNLG